MKRVAERLSPPTSTGYVFPRREDCKALKQRVILRDANRKAVCEVELCVGKKVAMRLFERSKARSEATKGSTNDYQ